MPSRRSDRGGSLRRQLDRAEEQQPELREALDEVARANAERDYLYKVGWEEFDNLDTDTRQDLIRESAVFGGLSGLLDAVTSPRRLAARAGARSLLSRYAPKLAKTIWGRGPSKSAKSLMNRIKKVREDRALSKQQKKERIEKIEKELKEGKSKLGKDIDVQHGGSRPKWEDSALGKAFDLSTKEGMKKYTDWIRSLSRHGDKIKADPLTDVGRGIITGANNSVALSAREMLANDSDTAGVRPDLLSLAERLLEAGERRGAAYLGDQEQKLKEHKAMKEKKRADDPMTATDEEYDRVFRREKEYLKR